MLFSSISTLSAKACRSSTMAKIKSACENLCVGEDYSVIFVCTQQNERTTSLLRSKPQQRLRCKS